LNKGLPQEDSTSRPVFSLKNQTPRGGQHVAKKSATGSAFSGSPLLESSKVTGDLAGPAT
jgi:hypothetical protein